MPATVIVGVQWGDEGKAKVLDALAEEYDIIVRYQGGSNAGHTVVVGSERYAFHLVPSGILRHGRVCVIANGVVVEPALLVAEIEALRARGVRIDGENLLLSDRAHLVMPYHRVLDQVQESRKGGGKIGTTGRGIGPCYADKAARWGIRAVDLMRPPSFREKVRARLEDLNPVLEKIYGVRALRWEDVADEVIAAGEKLKPFITDTASYLRKALDGGRRLLLEGAQGTLLDVDFGTYPYVTSSNSAACGAAAGTGIPPRRISTVLGVAKAYTTRVGAGPFPTEIQGAEGDELREKGGEYGTTTGRPRRCGWFDAVSCRYAVEVSGVDCLAITKLDVLTGRDTVRICTAYRCEGRRIETMPADLESLTGCEPEYEEMPGWKTPLGECRRREQLPAEAQAYVRRIEQLLGVPVRFISVGSGRDDTIRCGI
ncbi:MAG: adenylosuccinate synthase [Planctomycetota bacterium]|nr:adenylosuccinate synthase [Planctomycetota bacterium]